jgi:MFS family permease
MVLSHGERSLWPFYAYRFMRGVFFLTTITLFVFLTEKGLTYSQGAILVAIASLTQVASELITGSIADTYGRKGSVLLGLSIDAVIIAFIATTNSFWPLVILFALWGVSATLASGADLAWAIDSFIERGRESLLDAYYAKSRSFFNAGMIVAGILSSVVLTVSSNEVLWYVRAALTLLLALILLVFAKETFIKKTSIASLSLTIGTARDAIRVFRSRSMIRVLAIASFFLFFASFVAESVAIQDLKVQAGIPLEWWGLLLLVATFFGLFTPHLGLALSKRFAHAKHYLIACYAILMMLYGLAITSMNMVFIAILTVLYMMINDFYEPVEEKLYNEHTPSAQRASVNSLKAMIENLGLLLGMLLAGVLVDSWGGAATVSFAALFVIPAIVLLALVKDAKRTQGRAPTDMP